MYGTLERAGLLDSIGKDAVFGHERGLLTATRKAIAYAHTLAAEERAGAASREIG
jgi:hypothetical protein